MASIIIIPIVVVVIIGLSGYLLYRYAIYDLLCKRSVKNTLKKYNIKETPAQIIEEYHKERDESISHKRIEQLERQYRQKEPEQFLAMYDELREKKKNK